MSSQLARRLRSAALGAPRTAHAMAHLGTALARHPALRRADQRPTWPVSARASSRVSIRWPTEYEWPLAGHWVDRLLPPLSSRVSVTRAEVKQPYPGTVLIEVSIDGAISEVALDYADKSDLCEEVVERCALVFKMQYLAGGYGHKHVIPGGYVSGKPGLDRYLQALRHIGDHSRARFDVYGRFGGDRAPTTRRRAIELLSTQDRFAFEGNLAIRPYVSFLREAALSRVCIDLPGNGDMCHRLIDYLAIGCCVLRPVPDTVLHVPLVDGVHVAFVKKDLSNLIDVCADLLNDGVRRKRMARAAREHYDHYLRPGQLAGYYLDRCISHLGGGASPDPAARQLAKAASGGD